MKIPSVSIESLITDLLDGTGEDLAVSEEIVYKWAEEITKKYITTDQLIHGVALIDIKDYEGSLPTGFRFVCQVGCIPDKKKCVSRERITEWTQKEMNCELNISLTCPKCHLDECTCSTPVVTVDADEMWRQNHPEHFMAGMKYLYGFGRVGDQTHPANWMYMNHFHLMRPAQGTLWNTFYHLGDCAPVNFDVDYEYNIQNDKIIVNFKEGQVVIGYMGLDLDKRGYIKIPDHPYSHDALFWGIEKRVTYRKFRREGTQHAANLYSNAKAEASKYLGLARNALRIPSYDSWTKAMKNFRTKLWPDWDSFPYLNNMRPDNYKVPRW